MIANFIRKNGNFKFEDLIYSLRKFEKLSVDTLVSGYHLNNKSLHAIWKRFKHLPKSWISLQIA